MRRLLACLIVFAALPAEAGACSCAPVTREDYERASAAFAGTVTASRWDGMTVVTTLAVERTFKGSLPGEVEVRSGFSSCSFAPPVGRRVGLLLHGAPPWNVIGCGSLTPERLERIAAPRPQPRGRGRLAFLVSGGFGGSRSLAALDSAGGLLAYGRGSGGGELLSVCPGSRYAVQGRELLSVWRLRDLRLINRRPLPWRAAELRCLDRRGRRVVATRALNREASAVSGLLLIDGKRSHTLAPGPQPNASLGPRRAIIEAPGGTTLRTLDYATRRGRTFAQLTGTPSDVALSPDGSRVALTIADTADGESSPGRLQVVHISTGRSEEFRLGPGEPGQVMWVGNGRLVHLPGRYGFPAAGLRARVFDRDLREIGSLPGWGQLSTITLGSRMCSLGLNGELLAAALPDGPLRRFGFAPLDGYVGDIAAVPGRPHMDVSR